MMVTFTRLLVISMVASVRSESLRNCLICTSPVVFSSSSSFRSDGDKEKNAISEPEAKLDTNNKRQAQIPATMAPMDGDIRVTSLNTCKYSSMTIQWAWASASPYCQPKFPS